MNRLVLDNSVTMRWLFGDGSAEDQSYAVHVLDAMESQDVEALVPGIWALEMANVISKGESRGLLMQERSKEFLRLLFAMNIAEDPYTYSSALSHTLDLARRYSLSSYDASYLELSLRRGIPLATLDRDLQKAVELSGGSLF